MEKYKLYYKISIISLTINFFFGSIYRNYIYNNNISDFGIADIHPNILGVIVATFLFLGYSKELIRYNEIKIILATTIGFIIYEFIQITPLIGIFDLHDVLGSVIGGTISLLIYNLVCLKYDEKYHD